MNFKIVSIPRFVMGVLLLVVVPVLVALFLVHADVTERQMAMEKACSAKIVAPKVVEVIVTPTLEVSPTVAVKRLPIVVTPQQATGGAR